MDAVGICCIVVLALFALAFRAVERSLVLDFLAIDGDLQTWNSVRRILDGQRLGTDFDCYLGWLMVETVAWVSTLFGGGFSGTKAAASFLTGGTFLGLIAVSFRLCKIRWFWSISVALLIYVACSSVPLQAFLDQFKRHPMLLGYALMQNVEPGLSLRLLRAGFALVAITLLLWIDRMGSARTGWKRELIWIIGPGVLAGLALLWSTDYGFPTALALVTYGGLRLLIFPLRRLQDRDLMFAVTRSIGAAFIGFCVLLVLTGLLAGSMRGAELWWGYITEVSANSFWYYEGPDSKLLHLQQIRVGGLVPVASLLGLWALYRGIRDCRPEPSIQSWLLGIFSVTAFAITILNSNHAHYFHPLYLLTLAISSGLIISACASSLIKRGSCFRKLKPVAIGFVFLATCWSGADYWYACQKLPGRVKMEQHGNVTPPLSLADFRYSTRSAALLEVKELGGFLSGAFRRDVEAARAEREQLGGREGSMFSTYSGFYETIVGLHNPSRSDYLIHTIGEKNSRMVLETLKSAKPERVNTINPSYTSYEHWLRGQEWRMYSYILDNYDVFDRTPLYLRWRRRETPHEAKATWVQCPYTRVAPDEIRFELPEAPQGRDGSATMVAELEFVYSARPGRLFPKPYLVLAGAPLRTEVGLPFGDHERAVGLFVPSGTSGRVTIKELTPSRFQIDVQSARLRWLGDESLLFNVR